MSQKKPIPELAVYEGELPTPLELAKIAAAVGPPDNPREAVRNAMRLYLEATEFRQAYEKASPIERASELDDTEAKRAAFISLGTAARRKDRLRLQPCEVKVPLPGSFPAKYNDFLALVVRAKTPSDSEKRLRDFFRSQCPNEQDDLTFAGGQIAELKAKGLNDPQWYAFGCDYLAWWNQEKSTKATHSGKKPKKKSTSP